MGQQDVDLFKTWLTRKAGSLHKDVEIRPTCDRGWCIYALAAIPESTVLSTIPKSALLSVRNGALADVLEQEKIGGGPGLIAAMLHEQQKGDKSEWWGYLQSFPERVYVPAFWSPEQLMGLQGTSLPDRLAADRVNLQDDFDSIIRPLCAAHPDLLDPAETTFEAFCRAATFVSSRAFGVDDYHGMSLVPVADIFNHKAAVVELSSDYAIEPVCFGDESGSQNDGSSTSDEDAASNDTQGQSEPGSKERSQSTGSNEGESTDLDSQPEGVCRPRKRPRITRSTLLKPNQQTDPALRLEMAICGNEVDGEEVLEIVAASELMAGQEIHNTYGEYGNSELVYKYGFALRDNPFDSVSIDKQLLLETAKSHTQPDAFDAKCSFLNEFSELLEEEEEPFEVLPGGIINAPLAVTLRVLTAANDDFRSWTSLEDALPTTSAEQEASKEEGQVGNLDLAGRGPEGATPAMRDALQPALKQCLGRYSFRATADELQMLERKLHEGGMAHKELETCLAQAVAVALVLGEQGIIKKALENACMLPDRSMRTW
ncbi:hypothetical protein WJX74_008600 [Apatococcus lobatus]|uniref:N-lysine methyltransferase n=1 Tax=Apatococcus lobatus TaxID=904363 RepID=A0AAW1RQ00_9CHLO